MDNIKKAFSIIITGAFLLTIEAYIGHTLYYAFKPIFIDIVSFIIYIMMCILSMIILIAAHSD